MRIRNDFLSQSAALVVLLCFLLPCPAQGQIYSYDTHNLRLIYLDKAEGYLVPHLARCFENALSFHRKLFDYTPSEAVTVLLHDFNDYGTGGTNTIPWNYLSIGIEPYDYAYETAPTNERMNWVMNHELVHVLATDKAAGSDRFFRSLFGGKVVPTAENPLSMVYTLFTSPRWYSPRWYHEGIAVFLETWMAGGIGRVLGGYDEMVFRTMVRDSSYFYDYVGLESEGTTIDFQVGANSYLYGTRFVSYLAYMYGPEKLLQWFNRSEGSHRYFATQFEALYGISLSDAWDQWVAWEHQWQHANLDSVRHYPVTQYRPLTAHALGSVSRAFVDRGRGKIFVAANQSGTLPHIAAIDLRTGEQTALARVEGPALYYVCSAAYDSTDGMLFYTSHNGTGWRDINVVNVTTGDTRRLIANARTGDLAFNPTDKSLWGVQHHDGFSTVVRFAPPYSGWRTILPLAYGKDLFDLDISPDGRWLSAGLIEINGTQRLVRFDLAALERGDYSYDVVYEFENNAPENFVFSPDGRYLYGTTYYTGVSNVVRYDLTAKKMEWVSNTETGFFRPTVASPESLLVFRYTASGFLPVMIAPSPTNDVSAVRYLGQQVVEKYPIVTTWKLAPPSVVSIDSVRIFAGEYSSISHLGVSSFYPIVEGYKNGAAAGLRLNMQDLLGVEDVTLSGSYSPQLRLPKSERFHASASFRLWEWELSGAYNGADFYDLFGPTKVSRKGYMAGLRYTNLLIAEKPRTLELGLSARGFWGLERLPEAQNIATSYDKFYTFGAKVDYSYLLRTLGAVDYEQGFGTTMNISTTLVRQKTYPHVQVGLDVGGLFLVDHSSLWLRTAAGYSPGRREEPFANFFFGGFGNNWVDYQEIRRYREYYSFPGIPLNDAGGTTFGKAMLEWTLPPLRFKQFGLPTVYCTWMRTALFGGSLVTNPDSAPDRDILFDVGVQADFKLVMFSQLNSTFSVGYAVAARKDQRRTTELMVSLKIL